MKLDLSKATPKHNGLKYSQLKSGRIYTTSDGKDRSLNYFIKTEKGYVYLSSGQYYANDGVMATSEKLFVEVEGTFVVEGFEE